MNALRRIRDLPRGLGWLGVVALVALSWKEPTLEEPLTGRRGPAAALLGPVADAVSGLQWIRFQRARQAGRDELAIVYAESALVWQPEATLGWDLLASHLGLTLASVEREPDPERRLAWMRAGLAVAERGEAVAEDPAALALLRAVLFATKAEQDPELPYPGGPDGLWQGAAQAYERAFELGFDEGRDFASWVRAERAE